MTTDIAHAVHDASTALIAAGIDPADARLEAEVLLAAALGIDRTHLLARLHDPLDAADGAAFASLLERRCAREPLGYIIGEREFYGLPMCCSQSVLIPRPESELLVEIALGATQSGKSRIADVGTGSGCIAVAIAVGAPAAHVVAIDASPSALAVASRNIARHGVESRVTLREGDLLVDEGVFDVVVANLPYVSEAEWATLEPEVRDFEPREALVGGSRGTEAIERMLAIAPVHLAPDGVLAAEIGMTQGAVLMAAARVAFPGADVCVRTDFAGRDRVLVVRRVGRQT